MATPRLGLPQPTGTTDITTGDNDITAISNTLDDAALYTSGVFASRPAQPVTEGTYYYATDAKSLWVSDGAAWLYVKTEQLSARVHRSSAFTAVTAGVLTDVAFNNEEHDIGNLHDNATNNHRINLIRAGYWLVQGQATWNDQGSPAPTGYRETRIMHNSITSAMTCGPPLVDTGGTSNGTIQVVTDLIYTSSTTSYTSMTVRHNDTITRQLELGSLMTWFSATWLGA